MRTMRPFPQLNTLGKDEPEGLAIQFQDPVSFTQDVWPHGGFTRRICAHDLH